MEVSVLIKFARRLVCCYWLCGGKCMDNNPVKVSVLILVVWRIVYGN